MNSRDKQDGSRFSYFLKMKGGWKKLLKSRIQELPVLRNLLTNAIQEKETEKHEQEETEKKISEKLQMQQREMEMLNAEILKLRQRLESGVEAENKIIEEIDAFCTEETLKERIKTIERNYEALKADFQKYKSALS